MSICISAKIFILLKHANIFLYCHFNIYRLGFCNTEEKKWVEAREQMPGESQLENIRGRDNMTERCGLEK